MGRENDSWDDSALINAFDQALDKHKAMHKVTYRSDSVKVEEYVKNSSEEINWNVEHDERNNSVEVATDVSMPGNNHDAAHEVSTSPGSQPKEGRCLPEYNSELTGATLTSNNVNASEVADYNNLLSQYYEVEEKRKKILQQLQQVGCWNYPSSTECQRLQIHQDAATDTSNIGLLTPCCMCPSHCCSCAVSSTCYAHFYPWDAHMTMSLTPQINADGQCPLPGTMSGVEMAKASTSSKTFEALPNVSKDDKAKEMTTGAAHDGEMSQAVDPETDLTIVMNAWYSAGFYTGRYLLEQSMKKRNH